MKALRPLLALLVATSPVLAQTAQTWSFSGTAGNWSDPTNWTPNGDPSGNDIVFGDTGTTANSTTIGNVVDTSYTLNTLKYVQSAATAWTVTKINSGATLTLDAAGAFTGTIFSVGVTGVQNRVAITGPGTFTINESGATVSMGASGNNTTTTLDMSGLANFNATVATFTLGQGRGNVLMTLGGTNAITATTLNLGTASLSTTSGAANTVNLGTSNVFNVDNINVGQNYASGLLQFRTGLTNPLVTIRGSSGGSSRANLSIGNTGGTLISNSQGSIVDFSTNGGKVDALLNSVIIGRRADPGTTGTETGVLRMNSGTIDATSVVVGQSAGTGATGQTLSGTLAVSGGKFTAGTLTLGDNSAGLTSATASLLVSGSGNVVISGSLTAGRRAGTAAFVNSNVIVSNGSLVIQGNFTEGTGGANVTSSGTLSGGIIDMTHHNIAIDNFTMTGGTLKNVASFQAATTGGLNLQNAATLAYDIDGSFTSLALTGTMSLSASSNLSLTLANGVTPVTSYTLVDNDGSDAITGSFATINGASFGVGNTFSLTNDIGTYQFQLSYAGGTGNDLVATVVPEPKAMALAGLGLMTVLFLRRRQARARQA